MTLLCSLSSCITKCFSQSLSFLFSVGKETSLKSMFIHTFFLVTPIIDFFLLLSFLNTLLHFSCHFLLSNVLRSQVPVISSASATAINHKSQDSAARGSDLIYLIDLVYKRQRKMIKEQSREGTSSRVTRKRRKASVSNCVYTVANASF